MWCWSQYTLIHHYNNWRKQNEEGWIYEPYTRQQHVTELILNVTDHQFYFLFWKLLILIYVPLIKSGKSYHTYKYMDCHQIRSVECIFLTGLDLLEVQYHFISSWFLKNLIYIVPLGSTTVNSLWIARNLECFLQKALKVHLSCRNST